MPTLTLAVPKDLKKEMDSLPELNWSEIARKAISKKAAEFKLFKSITSKYGKPSVSKIRELLNSSVKSDADPTELIRQMRDKEYSL